MKRYSPLLAFIIFFSACKKDHDTPTTPPSTLTDGLVAYYAFSGNANDATSNNNNGTVTGASLTADRFGTANSAYLFDGVSDYITIPASTSLDLKQDFSISSWVSPDDFEAPGIVLWHGDLAFGHDPYILYFSNRPGYNSLGVRRDADDGLTINEVYAQSGVIFSNVWCHVVVTCNTTSKQLKLYINGNLVNSNSFSTLAVNYDTSNFFTMIGAATSTAGIDGFFKGKLDELRIYNREITQSEVTELSKL